MQFLVLLHTKKNSTHQLLSEINFAVINVSYVYLIAGIMATLRKGP